MTLARIIGHRGAGVLAPENTLSAFRAAAALGLAAVECDVRLSADQACVLLHDARLERTTDGRGALAATPRAALRGLDAGAWFGPAFAGEPVPMLEDAIGLAASLGLAVNVEIKAEPGEGARAGRRVAERLAALWPRTGLPCLLSSFDADALAAAGAAAPDLQRALIVGALPAGWRARLRLLGLDAIHCRADALADRDIAALAAAGVVWRCYTVDHPDRAGRLLAAGCAGVFTDRPDLMVALLA
jgi:glycerophosphoryl diester phosphodiesterase